MYRWIVNYKLMTAMAYSFNTSLKNIAAAYIQLLNVKVTATTVKKDIMENPDYPGLLSLADTFSKYRINNNAFKISKGELTQLTPPFVAFVSMPSYGDDFVLVTSLQADTVTFLYNGRKKQTVSKQVFLKRFRDIVWFADAGERSGDPAFEQKRSAEKKEKLKKIAWYAALSALLLLAIIPGIKYSINPYLFSGLLFLKLAGTVIALLLLAYETDQTNTVVKKLCGLGRQSGCSAVLTSQASKILGISWAEIGFFYFASTTIWSLYPGIAFNERLTLLALASAAAAPFMLFSLYYQWRVVKSWCLLCLTIQAILFLEFLLNSYLVINNNFILSLPTGGKAIFFSFGLPIVAWYGIKPLLLKSKDAARHALTNKRLHCNRDVFKSLLLQQPEAPAGWQELGLSIGAAEAKNIILKVCNPYCVPCAKTHPILEEIINQNEDVQLRILFTAQNSEQDKSAIVVRHLLAVAEEANAAKTRKAVEGWYTQEKKDYESFASMYTISGSLNQQDAKIAAMSKWCEEAGIMYTPTIFVNGHLLPENYKVEDLKNIL